MPTRHAPLPCLALSSLLLLACGDDSAHRVSSDPVSEDPSEGGARASSTRDAGVRGPGLDGRVGEDSSSEPAGDASAQVVVTGLDASADDASVRTDDSGRDASSSDGALDGYVADGAAAGDTEAPADAAVDAARDSGPSTPMCLQRGAACGGDVGTCCEGSTCATSADAAEGVCTATCSSPDECASGCCAELPSTGDRVCAPAEQCATPPVTPEPPVTPPSEVLLLVPAGCGVLELDAADGTFLGNASGSASATDSVCNSFGSYGNSFGASSIFNQYGRYGSSFDSGSAYNPNSAAPPRLVCSTGGGVVAYVTKGSVLSPRVDPDALCATLDYNHL
jgi:hypothetical protein